MRTCSIFELDRRRENESSFRTVASFPSQTPTGNSQVNRSYQHVDDNYYDNWSYYRLKDRQPERRQRLFSHPRRAELSDHRFSQPQPGNV